MGMLGISGLKGVGQLGAFLTHGFRRLKIVNTIETITVILKIMINITLTNVFLFYLFFIN